MSLDWQQSMMHFFRPSLSVSWFASLDWQFIIQNNYNGLIYNDYFTIVGPLLSTSWVMSLDWQLCNQSTAISQQFHIKATKCSYFSCRHLSRPAGFNPRPLNTTFSLLLILCSGPRPRHILHQARVLWVHSGHHCAPPSPNTLHCLRHFHFGGGYTYPYLYFIS